MKSDKHFLKCYSVNFKESLTLFGQLTIISSFWDHIYISLKCNIFLVRFARKFTCIYSLIWYWCFFSTGPFACISSTLHHCNDRNIICVSFLLQSFRLCTKKFFFSTDMYCSSRYRLLIDSF